MVWFEAPEPGEHNIFCTEYCGDRHGYMYSKVIVMPEAEFNAWIDQEADNAVEGALPGDKLFAMKGCAGCHSIDGTKGVGPSLKGVYGKMENLEGGEQVKADENYLRESILVPAAKIVAGYPPAMPSFQGQLSDEEVGNLIDYIKTLSE
jgi:cytochrome c oxidase subunit 2